MHTPLISPTLEVNSPVRCLTLRFSIKGLFKPKRGGRGAKVAEHQWSLWWAPASPTSSINALLDDIHVVNEEYQKANWIYIKINAEPISKIDTLAEWLTRAPAKFAFKARSFGSESSNLSGVVLDSEYIINTPFPLTPFFVFSEFPSTGLLPQQSSFYLTSPRGIEGALHRFMRRQIEAASLDFTTFICDMTGLQYKKLRVWSRYPDCGMEYPWLHTYPRHRIDLLFRTSFQCECMMQLDLNVYLRALWRLPCLLIGRLKGSQEFYVGQNHVSCHGSHKHHQSPTKKIVPTRVFARYSYVAGLTCITLVFGKGYFRTDVMEFINFGSWA